MAVNNPYFTLSPGTTWRYKSKDSEGTEINEVSVTDETKKVMGATTRVVHDRVWLNGRLTEETFDWYAKDKNGNVGTWAKLTEYSKSGKSSKQGSWEAGIDGAKPGIVMQSDPHPGEAYRQEYRKGEAEDMGQVLSLDAAVSVPYGSFKRCLKTKDWSAIRERRCRTQILRRRSVMSCSRPKPRDKKRVELVEVIRPPSR